MADEVVSHAFSHGLHPEHSERLAAYWVEALSGPATFSGTYGDETSFVRMHSGHGPHEEMDRRGDRLFRPSAGRRRVRTRRPSAPGTPRLLRVGHDDHDVPLSPLDR